MRDILPFFKALGDETRLNMLWLLMNHRELCVCDFMEVLQITQSKASRHLRSLFHADLVSDRREGLWVYYSLQFGKDPLVRSTLRAMKTKMTANTSAQQLLTSLDAWTKTKSGEERCA